MTATYPHQIHSMFDSSSCFDVIGTGFIKNEVRHNIQNDYVPRQIGDTWMSAYVTMVLISLACLGSTTSQLVETAQELPWSVKYDWTESASYCQRYKMYGIVAWSCMRYSSNRMENSWMRLGTWYGSHQRLEDAQLLVIPDRESILYGFSMLQMLVVTPP